MTNKKLFILCLSIMLSGKIVFSADLNITVNDDKDNPINDVSVILVPFFEGHNEPVFNLCDVQKTAQGQVRFTNLPAEFEGKKLVYKIGFSKDRYLPTIKQQIATNSVLEVKFDSDTDVFNTQFRMTSAPESFQSGRLKFKVKDSAGSSLPPDALVVCELKHKITDELVSFNVDKGPGPFIIPNVPPAEKDTYKLNILVLQTNEGAEVLVSTAVYNKQETEIVEDIYLGYVSNVRSEGGLPVPPSEIAFEGVVMDVSSKPIVNCLVILRDLQMYREYRTLTDAAGRFFFTREVVPSTYSVSVSKLGYISFYDNKDSQGYHYTGERIILPKYFLSEATGSIKGQIVIHYEGSNENIYLPDAWVTLTPENSRFQGPYDYSTELKYWRAFSGIWLSAVTDANGCFEFNGLPPGQYNLEINHRWFLRGATEYYWKGTGEPDPQDGWNWRYTYNYGDDQKSSTSAEFPYYRLDDDRRIVITSDTMKTRVYSSSGTVLVWESQDSLSIELPPVKISTGAIIAVNLEFSSDVVKDEEVYSTKGTLRIKAIPIDPKTHQPLPNEIAYYPDSLIPSKDLSGNIIVHGDISIPSPKENEENMYYVDIKSTKWAVAKKYNTTVKITKEYYFAALNIKMTKAGRLEGKIRLPDGSYFVAKEVSGGAHLAAYVKIMNLDTDYGERLEISLNSQDKTKFTAEGLPPGKYIVFVEIWKHHPSSGGSGELLYPVTILPNVRVTADETTFVEVVVKDGIICELLAPEPPEKPEVDYTYRSTNSVFGYGIIAVPSDVVLKGNDILAMIRSEGVSEDKYLYFFGYDDQAKAWRSGKIPPGKYNFYMIMARFYGPDKPATGYDMNNSPDEYVTVISRAENVNVKLDELTQGTTFQVRLGPGVMGPGAIKGRVKGLNIFLPEDGERFKNNMKEFLKNLPTVMIYDLEGNWRGYAGVFPKDNKNLTPWIVNIEAGDVEQLKKFINSDDKAVMLPIGYYIDNLPAGEYILVCETKNYPPVTKIVSVSTGTTTADIDFDKDTEKGGQLRGYIKDENKNPIPNANVVLTHKLVTKRVLTDNNGKFEVKGIPSGVYKIDVNKPGYATAGLKTSLAAGEDKQVDDIILKCAEGKITGRVYVRESNWGRKELFSGAKIVAYNETENVTNPGKYLPAIVGRTDNEGLYVIPDVIVGNTYYVYAFVPDRPVYYRLVYVSTNIINNIDFDIQPSTPHIKLIMKRTENPYIFRFIIEPSRPLVKVPECYYSIGKTFDPDKKTKALPMKGPKNTYEVLIELPSDSQEEFYTLQVKGYYGMTEDETVTETVTFSQRSLISTKKEVADELAEGGSVLIDDERADNTEAQLDPGTFTPEEFASMPIGGFLSSLPMFKMSKTSKQMYYSFSGRLKEISASDVYEIGLSRAQVNKSFSLALSYDRNKVKEEDLRNLKVCYYDPDEETWKPVPGTTTVDPLTGTISVETHTLEPERVLKTGKIPGKSVIVNGVYKINPAGQTSQRGVFAVFKVDPSSAAVYTGSEFKVYNFPNPFNLKEKEVNLADGIPANQKTKGTIIKYFLPKGKDGEVKFYIYNLAGELVKTIDEGEKTGGYCYYTAWDGTNDNGEKCASGVYFLVAKLKGEKLNNKPHKMAILK